MLGNAQIYYDELRQGNCSVHNDPLGTPQALTDENGKKVWTAQYDPFGKATVNEDPDGDGNAFTFNVRMPGQYYDQETGLHYNYFRYYDPSIGRYLTSDPIGLQGGPNTYAYVAENPIRYSDPLGLYLPFWHRTFTQMGAGLAGLTSTQGKDLGKSVENVDFLPGSQDPENAHMHAMCAPGMSERACQNKYLNYINEQIATCTQEGLAKAIHAAQDSYAAGHRGFPTYRGFSSLPPSHIYGDAFPTPSEVKGVPIITQNIIERFNELCSCNR